MKSPPAISEPSYDASAATVSLTPAPSALHCTPFQRAMLFAETPPAFVNRPPATSVSPCTSSASTVAPAIRSPRYTASAITPLSLPVPMLCHVVPSHRATKKAVVSLPAVVNHPPAIRLPFHIVSARTPEVTPVLCVLHAAPFHDAM